MACEDEDLLRQIAEYAGAINRHHNRSSLGHLAQARSRPYSRPASSNGASRTLPAHGSTRNRTLVFSKPSGGEDQEITNDSQRWISSRDRGHMTLTNATAYDATTAAKLARINEVRESKRKAKLMIREKKDAEKLKYLASTTLEHESIHYRINRKASMLIRIHLEDVAERPTPARTMIHGVEFLKSPKSHNLFRKSTIKLISKNKGTKKSKKYCKYFTRTGEGPWCFSLYELKLLTM